MAVLQCMVMMSTCGGGWQVEAWLDVHGQRAVAGQLGLGLEWRKLRTSRPGSLLVGSIRKDTEIVGETAEAVEKLTNPDRGV